MTRQQVRNRVPEQGNVNMVSHEDLKSLYFGFPGSQAGTWSSYVNPDSLADLYNHTANKNNSVSRQLRNVKTAENFLRIPHDIILFRNGNPLIRGIRRPIKVGNVGIFRYSVPVTRNVAVPVPKRRRFASAIRSRLGPMTSRAYATTRGALTAVSRATARGASMTTRGARTAARGASTTTRGALRAVSRATVRGASATTRGARTAARLGKAYGSAALETSRLITEHGISTVKKLIEEGRKIPGVSQNIQRRVQKYARERYGNAVSGRVLQEGLRHIRSEANASRMARRNARINKMKNRLVELNREIAALRSKKYPMSERNRNIFSERWNLYQKLHGAGAFR